MQQCQYNQILNKIYSVIRNDEKILKLMHYINDVDIEDESTCPSLTNTQKKEVIKNIKKFHSTKVVNGINKVYITMEFRIVDFSDTSKRNKYSKYFSNILFDIYVICPEHIEELQGGSRCMEIISRLQEVLSDVHVDAQKRTTVCGFSRDNTVDGFVSYAFTLSFKDINDGMIGRDVR